MAARHEAYSSDEARRIPQEGKILILPPASYGDAWGALLCIHGRTARQVCSKCG